MVTKKKRPPRNPKKFKSPKHRALSKNIIRTEGDITKAYQLTYPNASLQSAQQRASLVIKKYPEILNNTVEMLNKQGLSQAVMNERLADMLGSEKESVILEAIKTVYKLHGKLQSSTNINIDSRKQSINVIGSGEKDVEKLTHALTQFKSINQEVNEESYKGIGEIDTIDVTKEE